MGFNKKLHRWKHSVYVVVKEKWKIVGKLHRTDSKKIYTKVAMKCFQSVNILLDNHLYCYSNG